MVDTQPVGICHVVIVALVVDQSSGVLYAMQTIKIVALSALFSFHVFDRLERVWLLFVTADATNIFAAAL